MRPRRTPRQPRPVHLNTIERAIEGARKLPEAAVEALKIALDSTLTEFGQGIDCAPRWCCMADAMNVAEALAQIGICSDDNSKAIIHGGHQVLADVQQRRTAGGSWTLRGIERKTLDEAIWMHGVQLDHCSRREYEQAVQTVRARCSQARAGNAPTGSVVIHGQIQ
jgi:hypothetical protein